MNKRNSDRIYVMYLCALLGLLVFVLEIILDVITGFPLIIWIFGLMFAIVYLFQEMNK